MTAGFMGFASALALEAETCPQDPARPPLVRCARVRADHPDPAMALAACLGPDLATALVFASPRGDFDGLMARLPAAVGAADHLACTTAGEIFGGYTEDEIIAIGLPASHFATESVVIPDLTHIDEPGLIAAMIRARQALAARAEGMESEFAFLMVDGTSLREDALVEVLARGLGPVPMFGGSAGDGGQYRDSLLARGTAVLQNAAILTFVRTSCPIKVFSLDHLEPTESRMVVTRAVPHRRAVQEINAEPAAQEYARILGLRPEDLDPMVFAANPVVVRVGDRYHVRAIQRVGEGGELILFSAIDEGVVLTLARPADMAEALARDLGAMAKLGELEAVLACDCVLRRIESRHKQQTRAVSEVLAQNRVIGFSTYGEQFGAMHVNLTMTGVAIFRPIATTP